MNEKGYILVASGYQKLPWYCAKDFFGIWLFLAANTQKGTVTITAQEIANKLNYNIKFINKGLKTLIQMDAITIQNNVVTVTGLGSLYFEDEGGNYER